MEHRQRHSASGERAKLESEKLQLEIEALKKPFLTNPAHWISAVTAVLAITVVFFQYRLSRSEFILAESKSVQAKIETERAQESTKVLRTEVAKLQEEIADKSKRRDQLEALVRNADSLLSKAQDTADPNLRKDIDKLRETTKPSSPFWSSLPAILDQPQLKEAANVERLLRDADAEIRRVRGEIREKDLGKLSDSQTGYNADFKNRRLQNELAFIKPGYQQPKSYTKYTYSVVGNELRFGFLDGDSEIVFYRTFADRPVFNEDFEAGVRRSIEPQLKAELERTD
jgi:hypothetical protein